MGLQLQKIHSGMLNEVQLCIAIVTFEEFGASVRRQLYMSRFIIDYFSKEHSTINLSDPMGPLSRKAYTFIYNCSC